MAIRFVDGAAGIDGNVIARADSVLEGANCVEIFASLDNGVNRLDGLLGFADVKDAVGVKPFIQARISETEPGGVTVASVLLLSRGTFVESGNDGLFNDDGLLNDDGLFNEDGIGAAVVNMEGVGGVDAALVVHAHNVGGVPGVAAELGAGVLTVGNALALATRPKVLEESVNLGGGSGSDEGEGESFHVNNYK